MRLAEKDYSPELTADLLNVESVKDGWLDGDGRKVSGETRTLVRDFLKQLATDGKGSDWEPGINPTPNGGVDFVWYKYNMCTTLEPPEHFSILILIYGQDKSKSFSFPYEIPQASKKIVKIIKASINV